jgi:5-formyltetrahydrofolate cyclo-ligase
MSVLEDKKALRLEMLNIRADIPEEKISLDSSAIVDKLIALDSYAKSGTVMCFVDFKKEVRSRIIIKHALDSGKRVLVPVIVKEENGKKTMKASHLLDFEEDLASGTMGILEPKPERRRFIDPSEIDFFVTPGLAFDVHKNRLGYGAGYHDTMFKHLRKDCPKVAICFDFQVLEHIPVMDYDVPVDMILTEKRTIK